MANPAVARLQPAEDVTSKDVANIALVSASDAVLVHVRYQPNGEIFSIGAKPERLSDSQWLKYLLDKASLYYQTFAGGRGFFRIPRDNFEALLESLPA